MSGYLDVLMNGIMVGSIYSLLACGFVVIFKCTRVFNFSFPAIVIVGAYVSYSAATVLNINPLFAVLISMSFCFLLGFVIERLFLRRMIGEPIFSVVVLTIGLSEVLNGIVGLVWGNDERVFPALFSNGTIAFGDLGIPCLYIYISVSCLAVFFLLLAYFRKSPFGIAMRAVANQQDWASLYGIDPRSVFALSWGIAGAIGALSGVFLSMILSVNLSLQHVVIRAFSGAVLGGMDSILGALLGGLFVGISESFIGGIVDPYIGGGGKEVVAYFILVIILMIRPYGLFGTEEVDRA